MNVNIQDIVNEKIKEMEESRIIEKTIEDKLEKNILEAVSEAFGGYSLRRKFEEKINEQISKIVSDIGFTAYNTFIANKLKEILEGTCQQDIADKIQESFKTIFLQKRESIKLSEICKKYRDYICEDTDYDDKYSLENFFVSVEEELSYRWITFKFAKQQDRYGNLEDNAIKFVVHRNYDDKNIGWIGSVRVDNHDIKNELNFRYMSSIALLLVNLAYNKTPIEIDVESEDDVDSSFDIDI